MLIARGLLAYHSLEDFHNFWGGWSGTLGALFPQRGGLAQATKFTVGQNQVVQEGDIQELGTLQELASEADVLGAGGEAARRVVVGDDNSRSALADDFPEDFAGMSQGFGGGADGDDLSADGAIFDVEEEHGKVFLTLPHEVVAEVESGIGGALDGLALWRSRLKDPLAQLNGGQDRGGFGGTNAVNLRQLLDVNVAQDGQRIALMVAELLEQVLPETDRRQLAGTLAGAQENGDQLGGGKALGTVAHQAFAGALGGGQIGNTQAVGHGLAPSDARKKNFL